MGAVSMQLKDLLALQGPPFDTLALLCSSVMFQLTMPTASSMLTNIMTCSSAMIWPTKIDNDKLQQGRLAKTILVGHNTSLSKADADSKYCHLRA